MDEELSLLGGVYAVEILGRGFQETSEAKNWIEEAAFLVPDHKKVGACTHAPTRCGCVEQMWHKSTLR